jgi:hypothetical protein
MKHARSSNNALWRRRDDAAQVELIHQSKQTVSIKPAWTNLNLRYRFRPAVITDYFHGGECER